MPTVIEQINEYRSKIVELEDTIAHLSKEMETENFRYYIEENGSVGIEEKNSRDSIGVRNKEESLELIGKLIEFFGGGGKD